MPDYPENWPSMEEIQKVCSLIDEVFRPMSWCLVLDASGMEMSIRPAVISGTFGADDDDKDHVPYMVALMAAASLSMGNNMGSSETIKREGIPDKEAEKVWEEGLKDRSEAIQRIGEELKKRTAEIVAKQKEQQEQSPQVMGGAFSMEGEKAKEMLKLLKWANNG